MQKGKKLLLLCQYFYPEPISSAILPTQLATNLARNGYSVEVLCGYPYEYYNDDPVPVREIYDGVAIKRVRYINLDKNKKIYRAINMLSFVLNTFASLLVHHDYTTCIVYTNPPILPIIARVMNVVFGKEFIYIVYDIYPDLAVLTGYIRASSSLSRIWDAINRSILNAARSVVVIGSEMIPFLRRKTERKIEDKVLVIPNWYQDDIFGAPSDDGCGFCVSQKDNRFVVVYTGNIGILQDVETIKAAILELPRDNLDFVFTGHGRYHEALKNWCSDNKLENVRVYDFLVGGEYKAILYRADCCLVSLREGVEGLSVPSKTYGYLAAGKPVIAIMSKETDIARDLLAFNAGFVIEQGDAKALREALLYLMQDKGFLVTMGANARDLFNTKYKIEIAIDKYIKLIESL
jgi:glycosyltransferase involved in cell wall biosynthesis